MLHRLDCVDAQAPDWDSDDALGRVSDRRFATNRRWAALIYEVVLSAAPQVPAWDLGPLRLPLPQARGVTDMAWRCTSMHERARDAVYGDERRWHRVLEQCQCLPGSKLKPTAIEILRLVHPAKRGTNGLMVVHLVAESDGLALVADFQRCARRVDENVELSGGLQVLAPVGAVLSPGVRSATVLSFATHAPEPRLELQSTWDGVNGRWSELDQWRWALAAASPPSKRQLQSQSPPPNPGVLVRTPRREAQVLANGVAILATRPDTRAAAGADYDFDFVGIASIFLDVLLLGVAQRIRLAQLADTASLLEDPVGHPRRMRALQRDVRVFRNQVWWREASTWRWPDQTLRAYQNEHMMTERLEQLVDEIGDFGAEVQAVADQRFGEFLGIIALIGLPAAAASIMQAVHADAQTATRWIVVVTAVVALPLLLLAARVITSFLPPRRNE